MTVLTPRIRTVLILALLSLLAGTTSFLVHTGSHPLTYDEGDYYRAVQNGFLVNWTDSDDISIVRFVDMGLRAVRSAESRAELSNYIRSAGSTMFLRHYHPPLAFYPAILLRPFLRTASLPMQLRAANLFWVYLFVIVLAIYFIRSGRDYPAVMLLVPVSASLGSALIGFNMHLPFGVLAALFFFFWYEHERFGGRGLRIASLMFLAGALVTVEYGMFLIAFIAAQRFLVLLRARGHRAGLLRSWLRSAAVLLLIMLVLWPAGVLQLNLLKSYAFVAYISMFRLAGEPVAFNGILDMLLSKWNPSVVELLLLPILLAAMVLRVKKVVRSGSAAVALMFVLSLLYLQKNPTLVYGWYLFPAYAVLFLPIAQFVLVEYGRSLPKRVADIVLSGCVVLMFVMSIATARQPDYSELEQLHQVVAGQPDTPLIIPRSLEPQLLPYYPRRDIRSLHDAALEEMQIEDSLAAWREHAIVILPEASVRQDESGRKVGSYRVWMPMEGGSNR